MHAYSFKSPNFFIVTFLVIPLIFGREELLCSDSNAIEALQTPTSYCQAQGWDIITTPYINKCFICINKHICFVNSCNEIILSVLYKINVIQLTACMICKCLCINVAA